MNMKNVINFVTSKYNSKEQWAKPNPKEKMASLCIII